MVWLALFFAATANPRQQGLKHKSQVLEIWNHVAATANPRQQGLKQNVPGIISMALDGRNG